MSYIEPLPGRILIKDRAAEKIGNFNIQTDESNKEGIIGEVIAIGAPDERYTFEGEPYFVTSPVSVGNIIVYTKYHFSDVYLEGEHYKIVKFEDIQGWVRETAKTTKKAK